ncbi:hypothetical protein [Actinoallomurus sp. NPDC052274]
MLETKSQRPASATSPTSLTASVLISGSIALIRRGLKWGWSRRR